MKTSALRSASRRGNISDCDEDDIPDIGTGSSHYYDCLHPNETGYDMIASRWLQDIDAWKPPQSNHFARIDLMAF